MRELAEMGHRCLIVTSDSNQWAEVPEFEGPRLLEERDGLEVCWLRTLKSRKARSFARMLGWLHFEWAVLRMPTRGLPPPDVVVVSSLSLLTVLSGIVLRRRHRARLVVEIRDIWPLTLVEEGGLSPHNPIIKLLGWVERLGYRKADAIVGTMPNLGEHVEHVLGSPKPTYCIPMGYAPRFVSARPVRGAGQVAIPAPPGALVVGYAGTVGTTNALEPLFLAAEKMSAETGVHFVVLGDGDLLADYQRRFAHLRNLSFVAKVPKADVVGGTGSLRRLVPLDLRVRGLALRPVAQQADRLHAGRQTGAGLVLGLPVNDRRGRMWLVDTRRGRAGAHRRGAAIRRDECSGARGDGSPGSGLDPRAPQLSPTGQGVRGDPFSGRARSRGRAGWKHTGRAEKE